MRDAVSHNRTVAGFASRTAIAIGLLLIVLSLVPGHSWAATWWLVGVGIWAAGIGVWMGRVPTVFPMPVMDGLLIVADVLLILLAKYVHGIEPAFPAIYMMIGYIVFAVREWWIVGVHMVGLGASYAGVLAVGPQTFAPAGRWCAVMSIVATMGIFVRWLVGTVNSLAAEERQNRDAAEAATIEWERQSRAKSLFLARMSHELRTPLNVVLGFADLLTDRRSGELSDRQREYVADITDSARHLVTLVDDVLDLADAESAGVRLSIASVNVSEIVSDSVAMLRDQAASSDVVLTVEQPAELPIISADPVKLRQVMLNLLANAVRFTPSGGRVTVRLGVAGGRPIVAVEDTGIGVHPSEVEQIFTEYGQSAGTSDGTGLGLPLARRFVELHGGALNYRARLGGGSVFEFDLAPEPPAVDEATHGSARAAAGADEFDTETDADYSAFTQPASRANRALIGRISLRLWVAGGALVLLLGLITPWPVAGRIGAIVSGTALAALAIAFAARLRELTFRTVEVFAYVCILGISLLSYWVEGFEDLVPLGFGWMTMLTFALWPVRRAIVQMFTIAVAYAIVLVFLDPPSPLVCWFSIMTMLTFNANIVSWMIRELRELVVAEQDAHRNARRARAELAATSRHKSMFVANMSHELRTPLNAVIGFAELLLTDLVGPMNPRQREYAREIDVAARQLLAIINDVLDAAKIEAGQLALEIDVIPVRGLLERVIEVGNPQPSHLARVSLRVEPGADFIVADRQRIEQVLVHLVANAVKFTPSDGHVEVVAESVAHGEMHFTVIDSGIGIVPDQIDRVFDAFHQGTRLPADHVRVGTGLGLALAKGIVEMHGGRIWVTSTPDVGSTFTVALPVRTTALRQLEPLPGGGVL